MKKSHLLVSGSVVAILGLIAYLFLHQNRPEPTSQTELLSNNSPQKADRQSANSSPAAVLPQKVTAQAAVELHRLNIRPVLAEYYSTKDSKEFVDKYSKGQPSADTAYLMKQALMHCAPYRPESVDKLEKWFATAAAGDDPATKAIANEKLQALQRLKAECGGFSQFKPEDFLAQAGKLNPVITAGDDPVARAKRLASSQSQRSLEENMAEFREVVFTKDALAYSELANFFAMPQTAAVWEMNGPGTGIDPKLLGAAFAAAPCYFDGDCTRSQLAIDAQCLMGGDLSKTCSPMNIMDSLQQTRLSPAEYTRLISVLEWLRPGVEHNQWPAGLFNPRPVGRIVVK